MWAALLMAAVALSGGCATMTTLKREMAAQPPRRQERKARAMASYEAQRDKAQLEAALNRFSEGNDEACFQQLHSLVERRPDFVDARLQLAEFHLFRGEPQQAELQLRAAIVIAPERADLHHCLGRVLEASEQRQEALVHFERAAQLEPANPLYLAQRL